MEGLKPHPAIKTSAVDWLGEVPTHWTLRRLKAAAKNVVEQTTVAGNGEIYVALEHVEGWTGKCRPLHAARMFGGQVKHFAAGDVLFGKLRPYLAKVTSLRSGGVCVGEFLVLRSRSKGLIPEFLEHYLRSKPAIDVINSSTFGAKMPRADWNFIGTLPISFPSAEEQAAIVRYLDWANARLERVIRAKRKIIALLNEQKQAIISEAVTHGVDPSVPLTQSGVDWIGEIPTGWSVLHIKNVMKAVDHRSSSGEEDLLSLRMHHGIVLFREHFQRPPQARTLVNFKIVQPGQFVVNRMQAGNGLIFCSNLLGLVSPDYSVFDVVADVNKEFLGELMRSRLMRWKFRVESKGLGTGTSGFLRLYDDRFGSVHLALPPRDEQDSIMAELKLKLASLLEAVARVQKELDLLLEYRTRLIADVVTGKVDVRAAVSALPDEEPLDSAEPESDALELEDEELAAAGQMEE